MEGRYCGDPPRIKAPPKPLKGRSDIMFTERIRLKIEYLSVLTKSGMNPFDDFGCRERIDKICDSIEEELGILKQES